MTRLNYVDDDKLPLGRGHDGVWMWGADWRPGFYCNDTLTIEHGGVIHNTHKAILFRIKGRGVWIPGSRLRGVSKHRVRMTEWIAKQRGLID